jgi:hypothetical protein
MNSENDIKPVEIFAGNTMQATMIQTFLEDNGIQAFLLNDNMGTLEPWVVQSAGINPVKVIVSNLDSEAALKLIEEFNNSEIANDTTEDQE